MQTAYAEVLEIVSENSLEEGYKEIQSLVIESGDSRIQSEDIVRLSGWNTVSVLNVLKVREKSVVRFGVNLHTEKWYTHRGITLSTTDGVQKKGVERYAE